MNSTSQNEGEKGGIQAGHLHPTTQLIGELIKVFAEMGFQVAEDREIETEYYNFDALNFPANHPARDMQDTFWLKDKNEEGERLLPRTHTSTIQMRFMKNHKPPFRIIAPGKVFRNEATDATHEAEFYQIEGLYVDKGVSVAHLKYTLENFVKKIYGENVDMRLRPSFFPFVEPGFEVDIKKNGKWMEILGAGMVHPNVLRAGGIDPEVYSGFAFGSGVDRIVMGKFGFDDIREIYSGDVRLLNQF